MVHGYAHHARAGSEKRISGPGAAPQLDPERISRQARATGMVHAYALDARATFPAGMAHVYGPYARALVWRIYTRCPGSAPGRGMAH